MPLHPQAAAHLAAAARNPAIHTLSVADARRAARGYLGLQRPAPTITEVSHTYVIGPGSSLPVRIYRDGAAGGPVVLMLHGSGFVIADLEVADEPARRLAKDTGYTVVTVDYRKAPEHPYPAAIDDAAAALDWVASGVLDVDTNRIAVVGDSAGGNLTAALAHQIRDHGGPPIAAQALLYPTLRRVAPATDLTDDEMTLSARDLEWFWNHYLGPKTVGLNAVGPNAVGPNAVAPVSEPLAATDFSRLPQAFVATAEYDLLRTDGRDYANALRAAGTPVEYVQYPGTVHGFFWMDAVLDTALELQQDLAHWLRTTLEEN